MLICAQSGRVSGLEQKTDPASSARSNKKGLKDNNNRLLASFVSVLVQVLRYKSVGGLTVTALKGPSTDLRISELSILIRILKKPGGV